MATAISVVHCLHRWIVSLLEHPTAYKVYNRRDRRKKERPSRVLLLLLLKISERIKSSKCISSLGQWCRRYCHCGSKPSSFLLFDICLSSVASVATTGVFASGCTFGITSLPLGTASDSCFREHEHVVCSRRLTNVQLTQTFLIIADGLLSLHRFITITFVFVVVKFRSTRIIPTAWCSAPWFDELIEPMWARIVNVVC